MQAYLDYQRKQEEFWDSSLDVQSQYDKDGLQDGWVGVRGGVHGKDVAGWCEVRRW